MKRVGYWLALVTMSVLLSTIVFAEGAAERSLPDYPTRDITMAVAWGAGGGTDVICRVVSQEMAKDLGVNFNVVNKTGGNAGSIGMSYVLDRPDDGYTMLGQVFSLANPAIFGGGWKHKYDEVWEPYLIGGSPESIAVAYDSKYATIDELILDARNRPGEVTVSTIIGTPHHVNLLAFMQATGIEFRTVPYNGSAPSQNAVMAGEVDVTFTSVAEQAALLKGQKLRSLGLLSDEGIEVAGLGMIPTILDDYEGLREYLPVPQVLGMAIRNTVPDEYRSIIRDSFERAVNQESVKVWASNNYYLLTGETGDAAMETMNRLESLFSWTIFEIGAAQVSPAEFGIPRL